MQKGQIQAIYKELQAAWTTKSFLQKTGLKKKQILSVLEKEAWFTEIANIQNKKEISCQDILQMSQNTMYALSGSMPKRGWLQCIYESGIHQLYTEREDIQIEQKYQQAVFFYLETLRVFLKWEQQQIPFCRTSHFLFVTEQEQKDSPYAEEYQQFLKCFADGYVYELMRIGREIMPFDMVAHVAGVHMVAMHIARQLAVIGIPVDLRLVSGAAAIHDIGKYGCRENEVRRIPYLHYYYTDIWCKENGLSAIGHIAANHSTWDLELENLPVESLILIYADFRVKSSGKDANGKEIMTFYDLASSFQVILNKLDNVDDAKEKRYRHVYSRLEDFENYIKSLGVDTTLTKCEVSPKKQKQTALLNMEETVDIYKNTAISHNIRLMHKLSRELTFGNILEKARTTTDWKDTRSYLNIFAEYFTYMSQRQKQMTMAFLYELMSHREGDIRRQAADLLGNMIAHYDISYGKELPKNVDIILDETNGFLLWQKYLDMILLPDHKMIDKHKRWLGYGLKRVVTSLLENCKVENKRKYIVHLLSYYQKNCDAETAFVLADTIPSMPMDILQKKEIKQILLFLQSVLQIEHLELCAAILLALYDMADLFVWEKQCLDIVKKMVLAINQRTEISLQFLIYEIKQKYHLEQIKQTVSEKDIFTEPRVVSDIFLENLKAATPWKIKIINTKLLYARIEKGISMPKLHIATHLSNLLKISEQVSVRHYAGETLVRLAPLLSLDERNEVAIELTKGLEMGEFEFSKYIPQYLGQFALYLHPEELDEFLQNLEDLLHSKNDRIASVALDTCGVMLQCYQKYQSRFPEMIISYETRKKTIMGMLLCGFANYQEEVKREAFWIVGHELFGTEKLNMTEKKDVFAFMAKKMLMLVEQRDISELSFFNHTAGWNFMYRFISAYLFEKNTFTFSEPQKIAFFPGTFDPFTFGHQEIAREIRDMGFTVYLALDEFSWSKKAQPHMVRRDILNMSVAKEENIYLFPEDTPINIANPVDLKHLRELFPNKEVYMVAGSDVVKNASSYKGEAVEHSILTFPHVIFKRETQTSTTEEPISYDMIVNTVLELKLPIHFEDISSTRIRENIDCNRDISNLIDTVAQNYIYDRGLYLREPQYKQLLQTKSVEIAHIQNSRVFKETILQGNLATEDIEFLMQAMHTEDSCATVVFDIEGKHRPDGIMVYRQLSTTELYHEFEDMLVASHIRENTSGKIVLITAYFITKQSKISDVEQILLTETLAKCLREDFTYTIFLQKGREISQECKNVLERQGFVKLPAHLGHQEMYVVDMKNPVVLHRNVQTAIKEPFNTNPRVLHVLQETHHRFQQALTKLYPGELVISFDTGILYNRLIELITAANDMPKEVLPVRTLGKKMCVPFGKILKGIVIPNTVTKVLHTEKIFDPYIRSFRIAEFPEYLSLESQVKTIKSFQRPVILVDELLHKGYRIKKLNPIFKKAGVEIDRLIVGVLSGRGRDLMEIEGRHIESAYFIPSMRIWFVETSMYPFIGGDGIDTDTEVKGNFLKGVNLILPYVMPGFIRNASKESIYDLSMVCLQNAKEILTVLEEEYQALYQRNLTLGRLSEVVIWPRIPDKGSCVKYHYHLAASTYVKNDMEQLMRLEHLVK